ncbi:MAG: BolA family protein [Ghiorsea sp.]|nr:BolA family protein [Ghiorsea sp.]
MSGVAQIEASLTQSFSPTHLEMIDESHLHAGHAGAKDGGGHYVVHIVAEAFAGKSRLQKHRMVNDACKHLFPKVIHALSIQAKAPEET